MGDWRCNGCNVKHNLGSEALNDMIAHRPDGYGRVGTKWVSRARDALSKKLEAE